MKIGIIPNLGKMDCKEVMIKLCGLLEGKAEVIITDEVFTLPEKEAAKNHETLREIAEICKVEIVAEEAFFESSDLVVVMGGDGSLLRAVSGGARHGKPLLGINLGRVGYLASAEKSSIEEVAKRILNGDYCISEHMMLEVDNCNEKKLALNDVVISRSDMGRILEFTLFVDDELVDTYTADGVVIATPIGSTAYSLSAGGPVAYPYMDMLIITPICPHGLSSRPIVVPADKKITVQLGDKYDNKALVSADGHIISRLITGDSIRVGSAPLKTKLIKMNDYGFYDLLRLKLKGN